MANIKKKSKRERFLMFNFMKLATNLRTLYVRFVRGIWNEKF